MSAPHRGLPPPSAMTLPTPDRIPPPSSLNTLPPAPPQWQGADESMRNWLLAKSEEDRRKQEEERSRQEGYRLETRKIEQQMLHDALQGGIPPYLVPIMFAGMGGANVANVSVEWAQHYMAQFTMQQQLQLQQQQQAQAQQAQLQQQQHQQQHQQPQQQPQAQAQLSPEQRRDSRMLVGPQPNPYGAQQMQPASQPTSQPSSLQSAQQLSSQTQAGTSFFPPPSSAAERVRTQPPALQAAPPTSAPRGPSSTTLPRLNTVEISIQQPPSGTSTLQLPGPHLQQAPSAPQQAEQQAQSPTIFFHHWTPPTQQQGGGGGGKDPPTPSGKSQHESPYSQNQQVSHLRSEYTSSPKKRKATGSHQAALPPSSSGTHPPDTSPSFSSASGRRRGHSRQRSDASSRVLAHQTESGHRSHRGQVDRTESGRQSLSEAESGSQRHNSAQAETRQVHHGHHPGEPSEMRSGAESRDPGQERDDSPKEESEAPS